LKISTNIPTNDWNSFIDSHPEASIFQSPEMFELFEKTKKFEPLVLGVTDEDDQLAGLLLGVFIHERKGLFRLFSSRFVVYGGPLLVGDEDQKRACLDLLLDEIVERTGRKALFIQFRNFFGWEEHREVFEQYGFDYLDRLNYIIDLRVRGTRDPSTSSGQAPGRGTRSQKPETSNNEIDAQQLLLPEMSASRRRQIRKGLASGAKIIEPENIDQVKEFYEILHDLYRNKIRKPLPDWSFFKGFYHLCYPRTPHPEPRTGIGIIHLVRFNGRIIGGILAPVTPGKCIYEWYVCGLDKEYKDQYPSVLATWAGIEYAIVNKIESFDFMGVGKPGKNYGVREFKARFGGELVNYGRFTRINNKFLYNIAELGYNVLALIKKI
jgi:serine/alanine adding enzyme